MLKGFILLIILFLISCKGGERKEVGEGKEVQQIPKELNYISMKNYLDFKTAVFALIAADLSMKVRNKKEFNGEEENILGNKAKIYGVAEVNQKDEITTEIFSEKMTVEIIEGMQMKFKTSFSIEVSGIIFVKYATFIVQGSYEFEMINANLQQGRIYFKEGRVKYRGVNIIKGTHKNFSLSVVGGESGIDIQKQGYSLLEIENCENLTKLELVDDSQIIFNPQRFQNLCFEGSGKISVGDKSYGYRYEDKYIVVEDKKVECSKLINMCPIVVP